jgi:hypothetical protein
VDLKKTNVVFTDFDTHIADIEKKLERAIDPIIQELKIPYLMDLNGIDVDVLCSREFGSQVKSYVLTKVKIGLMIKRL